MVNIQRERMLKQEPLKIQFMAATFPNIHKWLAWKFNPKPYIICLWYMTFFSNT